MLNRQPRHVGENSTQQHCCGGNVPKNGRQDMNEGLYQDISNEDYHHSEECNALSSSGIKSILRSPEHFKESQKNNKTTPAMVFGSAVHSMVLEPDKNEVSIFPRFSRKKEDQEAKNKWVKDNDDKIIISEEDYAKIQDMKQVLGKHEMASMLLESGIAEQSGFWKHHEYKFLCKIRPDFTVDDLNVIVDYKTCIDASPVEFGKSAINLGYDIQARWYQYGMQTITQKAWEFLFIAQEKTPPYSVAIYRTDPNFLALGESKINKATALYAECLNTDTWSGYSNMIQGIITPTWAIRETLWQIRL